MRYLRSAVVAGTVAMGLLLPATAPAQITSLSVTVGHLQAHGTLVPVHVTVHCEPDWNLAFANATLTQIRHGNTTFGSGSFFSNFPGVPCPASETIMVQAVTPILEPLRFEPGEATLTVDVTVFNRETGAFADRTITRRVRLRRS